MPISFVGITSETINLDATVSQEQLLDLIKEKNLDPSIDGLLVQLPVPAHIRYCLLSTGYQSVSHSLSVLNLRYGSVNVLCATLLPLTKTWMDST